MQTVKYKEQKIYYWILLSAQKKNKSVVNTQGVWTHVGYFKWGDQSESFSSITWHVSETWMNEGRHCRYVVDANG